MTKKQFFLKSWYDNNNIFLVNTLINKDGEFLSYNQFTNIYGGVKTNFLEFFSVIQAVKKYFRQSGQVHLIREDEPLIPFHILPLVLDNTGNKKSYKILNYSGEIPTGQKKWNEYFLFTEQEWEKINVNVFKTTNDKKLQWLQYRINQRILTTNTFLKKIKISNNDMCTFCFREKETIEHVLYEFEKVQRFLSTVATKVF